MVNQIATAAEPVGFYLTLPMIVWGVFGLVALLLAALMLLRTDPRDVSVVRRIANAPNELHGNPEATAAYQLKLNRWIKRLTITAVLFALLLALIYLTGWQKAEAVGRDTVEAVREYMANHGTSSVTTPDGVAIYLRGPAETLGDGETVRAFDTDRIQGHALARVEAHGEGDTLILSNDRLNAVIDEEGSCEITYLGDAGGVPMLLVGD